MVNRKSLSTLHLMLEDVFHVGLVPFVVLSSVAVLLDVAASAHVHASETGRQAPLCYHPHS
jgi:hypothetical protein